MFPNKITSYIWNESIAEPLKVLIDLNLIPEVLQKREPFYTTSARVLAFAETGPIAGIVAAQTLMVFLCFLNRV